jgi:putative phage-type endonuclease
MIQRSAEWFKARAGKVTASRVSDVIARTKSGYSEKRAAYMMELIAERLTGDTADHFPSNAMQWGIDHEALARSAYEAARGVMVEEVGFIQHPTIAMSGASPDGLVGADGLLEIKCPTTRTHLWTVMSGGIPEEYKPQIGWQLECTGRAWCDFVSFDPRLPESYQLIIRRITRDEISSFIDDCRAEVVKFLDELAAMMERLAKSVQGGP